MKIKIDNHELTVRNTGFDGEIFEFVTDDPPVKPLESLFNSYDVNQVVKLDIGGIVNETLVTMFLPFDNHKAMSYNIRMMPAYKAIPK